MCNGTLYDPYEEPLSYHDTMFWVYLSVYVALVLFAGKFANHFLVEISIFQLLNKALKVPRVRGLKNSLEF